MPAQSAPRTDNHPHMECCLHLLYPPCSQLLILLKSQQNIAQERLLQALLPGNLDQQCSSGGDNLVFFLPVSHPCAHVYHVNGGTCDHREGHSPGNAKGMDKKVGLGGVLGDDPRHLPSDA